MQDILIKAGCYIAIIILGIVLRRTGFFKEEDFNLITKLVMKVTLPAALISSSAGMAISPSMLTIVLLGFGGGVIYVLVAFAANLRSAKERRAFEVLNTPGYNIGTFALPFTQNFLGSMGVVTTSLFDVGNVFICLGGAYGWQAKTIAWVREHYGDIDIIPLCSTLPDGKGFDIKRIFRALGHSLPFLVHVTMVALNLCRIRLPGPFLSFTQILANANAFLAMLMIGVGFKISGGPGQIGRIVRILFMRYSVAAVLAFTAYFLLPFELEVRQALVILFFSPIGVAVPGFTLELKEDVGLSCTINSMSILISIVIIVSLLVML